MNRFKFPMFRAMLGTGFAALAFDRFGEQTFVASAIAISMFVACCIASRDEFVYMFVLIALATIGHLVGSYFIVLPWLPPLFAYFVPALTGCVLGVVACELHYWWKRLGSSKQKPDTEIVDSDAIRSSSTT